MHKVEAQEKDPRLLFKEYLESKGIKHTWLKKQTSLSSSHLSNLFAQRALLSDDCREKINKALGTNF